MGILRRLAIPPFAVLLPIYPAVALFARNHDRLTPMHAVWTGLGLVAVFAAILLLLRAVFRKPEISDLLWAVLFAFLVLPVLFVPEDGSLLPWTGFWLAIAALVVAAKPLRRHMPAFVAILCASFIAVPLLAIFTSPVLSNRSAMEEATAGTFDPPPAAGTASQPKRDIYYLIFDRYARNDQLKAIYGFDNSQFLAELEKRGFTVLDDAYSNYQRTTHSVISSLNFDYLDRLQRPETKGSGDWLPLYRMLQDFRIGRFLKAQGYDILFSGTWWEPTRRIAIADGHRNFYEMPELARVIYENSPAVAVARYLGLRQLDPLWWQCQRSRLMFESLGSTAEDERPVFYFAHFLIPHPPFVTHETGRCLEVDEALSRTREENYVGQMKYANARLLAAIDRLLAKSEPKPIIILQADEGPWPKRFANNEVTRLGRDVTKPDWTEASPAELREKMAIFSALYLPAHAGGGITESTTPVNFFRIVLRDYFGADIEPLPDRNFIYQNGKELYHFLEVTDALRGN